MGEWEAAIMKTTNKRKIIFFGFCLAVPIIVLIIVVREGIKSKEPIRIGLVSTFTGGASTRGIHQRNGAIFAVEQINSIGGIKGRQVDLIVLDDKADPEEALRVVRELIAKEVSAILGPFLSTSAMAVLPVVNEKNVLMMGFAIGAELSGLDDNFIRMTIPLDRRTLPLASLFYNDLQASEICVVTDISNSAYSMSLYNGIKKEYNKLGGKVSKHITSDFSKEFSAPGIAGEIIDSNCKGVFIITNGIRSALICQHLRRQGFQFKVVVAPWGFFDPEFIKNGGLAVEGALSIGGMINYESSNEDYLEFVHAYEERFGEKVNRSAQMAYATAQVLFYALSKTDDPKQLKEIILQKGNFSSVEGQNTVIDQYGDAYRPISVFEVQNGKITSINRIEMRE